MHDRTRSYRVAKIMVHVDDIAVGDIMIVKPGQKIEESYFINRNWEVPII